ncbi:DeoR/GlpR family DNA-binding transcription regulator [Paenibacillus sp. OAS669]|uniref:DeoR/GlpR family DNA-binding transcription regulator n=1 Tax=Paenibacillus sp. OAS669 TaxID=2663821 RepID=UPI0017892C0F|nr:DeoR/GlpR family DNA-binding transcription regulator [Paenibacillus sp. OAS669]MBE1441357.1 DeoR/GlpR family transcriptional regulator of sugar metabolism [Paenibacillus sp. OAS669]
MYQEERLIGILNHLEHHQRINIETICELFDVSRDTARRDIIRLEEQGRILRTRGGAILPTLSSHVANYSERLRDEATTESKKAIGRMAATLIHNGDYLLLDASTTVQYAAESLHTQGHVVVTNSIDIADILNRKEHIDVHLLGGKLHPEHRLIYGARAMEMLSDYHVHKLLLGTCAITHDGLSNPYEEEGFLVREMMRRADQVILLADHTKFGKRQFNRISGLEPIDIIITDEEPSEEMKEALHRHEIDIIVAKGENPHD